MLTTIIAVIRRAVANEDVDGQLIASVEGHITTAFALPLDDGDRAQLIALHAYADILSYREWQTDLHLGLYYN